jgi:sporulation protein YlmC with PRC-barrel domain
MTDPVSWLMIEQGWSVVGSDGDEIGKVSAIDADAERDIFSGLEVRKGLLASTYVPAERVQTITEGRIELDVAADELP